MNKEKLEGLLIDYIDGRLSDAERMEVEKELAANDQSYKLYEELREVMQWMGKSPSIEPSQRIGIEFEKSLQAEQKALKGRGKQVFFNPVVLPIGV